MNAADESEHESIESDDEFQICQVCNVEEVLLFMYTYFSYLKWFYKHNSRQNLLFLKTSNRVVVHKISDFSILRFTIRIVRYGTIL
jgi:hypothetical protein